MLGLHCCAGFSLVMLSGGFSLVAVRELLIAVFFFFFFFFFLLRGTGSRALEHRPGSRGVSLPCGTWDLSDPGIRPASPAPAALAGGFFPSEPPGKPLIMAP